MGDSLLGRVRRGPILLVLATGNLLAVAAAVAAAGPISGPAPSRSTIGRTWPIAAPVALPEIEDKLATLPTDITKAFGPRNHTPAPKPPPPGMPHPGRDGDSPPPTGRT